MKLLHEIVEDVSTEIITEAESKQEQIKIKGPFIHCGEKNRNGRIYVKEHMLPEVTRYITEYVKTNRAVGELSHPEGPSINPDRVSHLITKLEWDGDLCMGEAKILKTPTGKILEAFIRDGVKFGVSTRGLGSIKESNGVKYVQPDFRLVTVDAVLDPSGIQCFSEGILEGKEWLYVEGVGWTEQYAETAKKTLQKINTKDIEPVALQIFENFLAKL
jgi:Prohead core protein serine protease